MVRVNVLRGVLRAPVSGRTWAETLYLIAAIPLAGLGFAITLVMLALGVGLSLTFIGLPLLALSGPVARGFGAVHRALARALLGERVPAPPPAERRTGVLGWLSSSLSDGAGWRVRSYLLVRFPFAVASGYLAVGFWGEGLVLLAYPVWRTSWSPRAVLLALAGIAALFAAPWVVRGLVWLDRRLIRGLLGPARVPSRVQQLEAARAQVVDESATVLRRIERDLHDGTQAQLATLAMTLGQAKEKLEHRTGVEFDPAGALDLVDNAHRHAKEALVELRDIARGIHPPALDVGLDAALATLVARSAVPAVLHTDIPDRPARAIETIAYFSAAELLANVAKHSRARRARVEVSTRDGTLRLRVSDDGTGGARPGGGSGLTGLMDRVRAVDGQLSVSSPPGGPTVIDVQLPLRP